MLSISNRDSIGNSEIFAKYNDHTLQLIKSLRERLSLGDESVVVPLALQLVLLGTRNRDISYIEEADRTLIDAAKSGNSSAIEYLANEWLTQKQFAISRIKI